MHLLLKQNEGLTKEHRCKFKNTAIGLKMFTGSSQLKWTLCLLNVLKIKGVEVSFESHFEKLEALAHLT